MSDPAAAHIDHLVLHNEGMAGIGSGLMHVLTSYGHLGIAALIGGMMGLMPWRMFGVVMAALAMGGAVGLAHGMAFSPFFETGLGVVGLALGVALVTTASALISRGASGVIRARKSR
ncbi:MAG: hypothetical protein ACE363_15890 [Alphaproteobacteria bacterium]